VKQTRPAAGWGGIVATGARMAGASSSGLAVGAQDPVVELVSRGRRYCLTSGVHGEQGIPIFLPLGALCYLNGHGQN
jgi:hypothetical protein